MHGLSQPVGVGASFDDLATEGEPVDDGSTEAGIDERFGPSAEGFVRGENNLSTPAPLYNVEAEHMHNLFNIESPLLGILATLVTTVLTALLLVAFTVAIRDTRQAMNTQAPSRPNTPPCRRQS